MKFRKFPRTTAVTLLAALALTVQPAAQEHPKEQPRHLPHYKLIDLGTFGGPNSGNNSPSVIMNNEGAVTGFADTPIPDPYAPNCFGDCFVQHAFEWRNGVLTDLGPLPGGSSSYSNAINSHNQIVGQSQNGLIDPLTGMPEFVAAVWQDGRVIDLGTFGGGFSLATANNNQQQVVGCAFNDVPDSFTPTGVFYGIGIGPQQLRAFRWQGKQLRDLGTLGGPDACAVWVNDRGQIAGASFTSSIVNPATSLPTLDPFLWEHGRMLDLGTLGGTVGFAVIINNQGQVAGQSDLTGDVDAHAFLWERGTLTDLGTLGGTFSTPIWLNDAGEVVGLATTLGDQIVHASVWRNGVIRDLGTLEGDCFSVALALNSEGQIVGQSFSTCDFNSARAVLWEKGGPALDLNHLVDPGSGLQLTEAKIINDLGEIVAVGLLPNGDLHSVVLIPCEEGEGGCGNAAVATSNGAAPTPIAERPSTMAPGDPRPSVRPGEMLEQFRARWAGRHHIPLPGAPRD
jgi:probable HAF family extracellular repeat protein